MLTATLITLAQLASFVGISTLVKRHKPHSFHSQNTFSVLLGIYLLFFILTAFQSVRQVMSATS